METTKCWYVGRVPTHNGEQSLLIGPYGPEGDYPGRVHVSINGVGADYHPDDAAEIGRTLLAAAAKARETR